MVQRLPIFVRGDIDGFVGLFIDNLLQLMLIWSLCRFVVHLPGELVDSVILPACAVSILVGNIVYSIQAWKLMRQTGRRDVTALPYGINTVSLFVFIFAIMLPVYQEAKTNPATMADAPMLAWKAGVLACFLSGIIETAAAFVGDWLRRVTPRAALLSALAGIAITFICMPFIFQLFTYPAIALAPMFIILFIYGGRVKLPMSIPGGLVAIAVGAAMAWVIYLTMGRWPFVGAEPYHFALELPKFAGWDVLASFVDPSHWKYLSIIVPMGLFNALGSLQNLESAEAAGDRYRTMPSLLTNGVGTLVAASLGSCFPTTIYIGHPGWKAMGARSGYSLVNGVAISAICVIGGVNLVMQVVPLEVALGILLWIGIVITAQSFQETPKSHALAVAVGFVPALAAWGKLMVGNTLGAAGLSLESILTSGAGAPLWLHGILVLDQGFILTSLVWAAAMAMVVDRRFLNAAWWMLAAAGLAAVGMIHAYEIAGGQSVPMLGLRAATAFPAFWISYLIAGVTLVLLHLLVQRQPQEQAHL